MVNLAKKSPEERLNICRKYYLGGFAFLPLLWLINAIWFYKQAFKVEPYAQQRQIRTCKSLINNRHRSFSFTLTII
jgi:presenilin enhancer 2